MPICIYCCEDRKFNSEHAFPYSLGGGGQGWTLNDMVCEVCNNSFSTMERELARSSMESLARVCYGPEGRQRKERSRKLPLYADNIFYLPDDNNLAYEGGMDLGLVPYIRAQIIETAYPIHQVTGSERNEIFSLLDRLKRIQDEGVYLVTKTPSKKGEFFEVSDISFEGKVAVITGVRKEVKLKNPGIWFESFPEDLTRLRTPRLFLDDEQRLVLRAENIQNALDFLGEIVYTISNDFSVFKQQAEDAETITSGSGPKYGIYMKIKPLDTARAIAKIGMNHVAILYGNEFALNPIFDNIKSFINGELHNTIEEMVYHVQHLVDKPSTFDAIATPSDRHWMSISHNIDKDIIFSIRFYGVGGYKVKLGTIRKLPFKFTSIKEADYLSVNYTQRNTTLLTGKYIKDAIVLKALNRLYNK
ncbi:hypothetical protein M2444_005655 [Paenibacillus sp. PastF-3]|uniref:hypothetical protein n=1 Tax=Paenibacillus sp. PastF-3 TaxID=2940626 RepID=UPI002472FE4F|nr:hypothetical protein [Paenibacillus sp. PastF-3]MDH6373812.1 hypothetical protein [Paenibacillus sp. PastF-3]